jgi:hypothetical protein
MERARLEKPQNRLKRGLERGPAARAKSRIPIEMMAQKGPR